MFKIQRREHELIRTQKLLPTSEVTLKELGEHTTLPKHRKSFQGKLFLKMFWIAGREYDYNSIRIRLQITNLHGRTPISSALSLSPFLSLSLYLFLKTCSELEWFLPQTVAPSIMFIYIPIHLEQFISAFPSQKLMTFWVGQEESWSNCYFFDQCTAFTLKCKL